MSTDVRGDQGAVARAIGGLTTVPFLLFDVGASGGIDPMWQPIGARLTGFGFDPNKIACDELNARGGQIEYVPAYLVGPAAPLSRQMNYSTFPYGRLQAEATLADQKKTMEEYFTKSGLDFVEGHEAAVIPHLAKAEQRAFFPGREISDHAFTIDEFGGRRSLDSIDFIKIDVDGKDFEVLRGAERSLLDRGVLGVQIESQFAGAPDPYAETFANIDIYLRARGFTLFSITGPHRYGRRYTQGKFQHEFPSQGYFGQVMWCDAIYLRDVVRGGYFEQWPIAFDLRKLLNLICLYDLYDLPDCAVELILSFAEELARSKIDIRLMLRMFHARVAQIDATASKVRRRFW
jgi:FkbM family methyltransferase